MSATACVSALVFAAPVWAQDNNQLQEIIVTARKRQESILNVPVIETALPQAKMERLQTVDLQDVAKLVPGLSFGQSTLTVGTQVSIRGVGTTVLQPGVDQSVSLNIDGLPLGQGLAYNSGLFDLGQVEVLKGPQSLFYGKASPGGVISMRTADPTDKFEIIGRAGHEFYAQENRAELIISGPVTNTVKMRLATMWDHNEGYFTNDAVGLASTGAVTPQSNRIGPNKSYQIRLTTLWNPIDKFDARVKLNVVHDRDLEAGQAQFASCPNGTAAPSVVRASPFPPFDQNAVPWAVSPLLGNGDCRLDRNVPVVDIDPAVSPRVPNGGVPFLDTTQKYGTVELNYRPRPDLTVTSVTSYYNVISNGNLNADDASYAAPYLQVGTQFTRHDITEEVRVNSDFSGPVNFTLGNFYQDGDFRHRSTLYGDTLYPIFAIPAFGVSVPFPAVIADYGHHVKIKSESVFGQVRWKVIPDLEIAAGARWTDEKRTDNPFLVNGPGLADSPAFIRDPKLEANNVSPELTVTYRPADTLTIFAALKKGYKSGSFDVGVIPAATPANALDISFGDEKVEGGEIGVKSRLLDRRLALDLAAYDYRYTGLQIGTSKTGDFNVQEQTVNAGSALVYGVDFAAAYRPEIIDNLTLNASVNWNHARFKTLDEIPCYAGQTVAMGCNENLNPNTGLFTGQNLTGIPLVRAPDWQSTFGFDWETPIGNDLTLQIANSNQYSSKYLTVIGNRPDFYQEGFIKADVSITLKGPKDRWELALIGKNLNDRITAGNCATVSGTVSNILPRVYQGPLGTGPGPTATDPGFVRQGGTSSGPGGPADLVCWADRGREVWLRLTVRPFN